VVYLTCALFQAGFTALIATGAVADPGLFRTHELSPLQLVMAHGLVQMVLLCTFVIARRMRSATLAVAGQVERMARVAAHREALLQEAREELERARHPQGAGRFSEQVIGSFKLGMVLGRGASGEVYDAVHSRTGEPAAVKLLRREALGDPGLVQRFLRESQILRSLDAENVVRVLETGDLDATLPYIAMERLRGEDLSHHLRSRPRLPPGEVLAMLRQVGRGVDAAHRAGIVHRDLKPANVFLHDASTWKILDFGVSKLRAQDGTLTVGFVVGTPSYMAPEQARGSAVDARADLYALGVIAFRALTGELPFRGRDTAEILYNVVHSTPPRPTELAPELSPRVDGVIATALAKDPADRFPSAAALVEGLAQALRSLT
jgi:serine/threonine-protein kinase